jgi:hypothetical protein
MTGVDRHGSIQNGLPHPVRRSPPPRRSSPSKSSAQSGADNHSDSLASDG